MADVTRRNFLGQSAAAGAGLTAAAAALDRLGENAVAAEDAKDKQKDNGLRLCRYQAKSDPKAEPKAALYFDDHVVDLQQLAAALGTKTSASANLMDYLPPDGKQADAVADLAKRYGGLKGGEQGKLIQKLDSVKLLVPIPAPEKVILLAGNYNAHIVEGGGASVERKATFPYFFWKPPSTTLTHFGDAIRIPAVSPDHVDWELELGVIIGKRCKDVAEKDALSFVAGYSVCNDVSDRKFRINAERKERAKDGFFDWLHGKWHDTFLPMGPCVRSAASLSDPQTLAMNLKVNDKIMQDANTGQMIFPVAAIVSILSSFMTLEPGDTIVTGTPAGVGAGRKPPIFLKKGDVVEAWIEGIGLLRNPVV